jgi:hypothetical protein
MMHLLCRLDRSLLLSIVIVDLRDIGIIAIKDSRDLFKGWALGLDVEEEDKDKLDSDPNLFLC